MAPLASTVSACSSLRTTAVTSWPLACSSVSTCDPMNPVAPVSATFMTEPPRLVWLVGCNSALRHPLWGREPASRDATLLMHRRSWRPWPTIEPLKSLVRASWVTDYGFLGFDRKVAALNMKVQCERERWSFSEAERTGVGGERRVRDEFVCSAATARKLDAQREQAYGAGGSGASARLRLLGRGVRIPDRDGVRDAAKSALRAVSRPRSPVCLHGDRGVRDLRSRDDRCVAAGGFHRRAGGPPGRDARCGGDDDDGGSVARGLEDPAGAARRSAAHGGRGRAGCRHRDHVPDRAAYPQGPERVTRPRPEHRNVSERRGARRRPAGCRLSGAVGWITVDLAVPCLCRAWSDRSGRPGDRAGNRRAGPSGSDRASGGWSTGLGPDPDSRGGGDRRSLLRGRAVRRPVRAVPCHNAPPFLTRPGRRIAVRGVFRRGDVPAGDDQAASVARTRPRHDLHAAGSRTTRYCCAALDTKPPAVSGWRRSDRRRRRCCLQGDYRDRAGGSRTRKPPRDDIGPADRSVRGALDSRDRSRGRAGPRRNRTRHGARVCDPRRARCRRFRVGAARAPAENLTVRLSL